MLKAEPNFDERSIFRRYFVGFADNRYLQNLSIAIPLVQNHLFRGTSFAESGLFESSASIDLLLICQSLFNEADKTGSSDFSKKYVQLRTLEAKQTRIGTN